MQETIIYGGGPKVQQTVTLQGNPVGYQQLTVSSSAVGLTVPNGANKAVLVCTGDSMRWRDDGVDPTATVGMPLLPFSALELASVDSLRSFKGIRETSDVTLNINYYKV